MISLLPGVRILRGGRVVAGGSPWRAVVLDEEGAARLAALLDGEPDAALATALVDNGLAVPAAPTLATGDGARLEDVTVVIPVHDDAARLPRALASLPVQVQVVVVDDGSRDDSAAVASQGGATVLRHETARGPAAARNAGLRAAPTELVAFLDADVSADPCWLGTLLPHLAEDQVALVGPRITALDPGGTDLLARYEAAVSPLDRGPQPAKVEPRSTVDYLPSAALVGRRAALLSVGGFDESLHFGEDVDLCHRLDAAGWQVRYDPRATVRHDHRTRWLPWLRRRVAYASAAPDVAARHGTPHPPVPAAGALAAAWLLFAPGRLGQRTRVAALAAGAGALLTATQAARAGVPVRPALEGAARREAAGAQRVLGMLPRQQLLPAAAAWAVLSRRGSLVVPGAVVLQHLKRWRGVAPDVPPAAFVALRLVDEAALSVGLWRACWRARTLRPLLPRLEGPTAVRRVTPAKRPG